MDPIRIEISGVGLGTIEKGFECAAELAKFFQTTEGQATIKYWRESDIQLRQWAAGLWQQLIAAATKKP